MKFLTTLAAAHQLGVSKQTLLNWLYAGKVPEPPRNGKGYRLWSETRVALVRKLMAAGRIHRRTVLHREAPGANDREFTLGYAREVRDYLREGRADADAFLRELNRLLRPKRRHGAAGTTRRLRPSARKRRAT